MKSVIKTARTVDEAVQAGLQELYATKEEAQIDVLEEPSRGLFGLIGSKDAVVRISVEDNVKEEILRDLRLPYVSRDDSPERMKKKTEEPAQEEKKPVKKAEPVREEKPERKKERRPEPRRTEEVKKQPEPVPVKEEKKTEEPAAQKPARPAAEAQPEEKPSDAPKEKRSVGQAKPFRVTEEEAWVDVDTENEPSAELLKTMLSAMELSPVITARRQGQILHLYVSEVPDNQAGLVIGRRGETLDAMQYLITLASHRKDTEYRKVVIDINDYRKKRDDALRQLAVRSAEKVLKNGKNMRLEAMNPYERRIIHSELQKMEGIHTISEGQEPYRRIVIRVNRNR